MKLMPYLKDFRVAFLLVLIVLFVILDALYGGPNFLHLGVEFVGGTQIPVQLEHGVDAGTMANLITVLQGRLSTFGLKQVTVEGIGNSEIYVTIPSVSQSEIQSTISVIESQGVFQGIVSGREAINGSGFISGSIGASQPIVAGGNVSWSVSFFITPEAASRFSKIVLGQANKPLYMFLDRPNNAIVLLNASLLNAGASSQFSANQTAEIQTIRQATALGNSTIPVEIYNPDLSNIKSILAFFSSNKGSSYSKVILTKNTPRSILENLSALNYTFSYVTIQNMTPSFIGAASGLSQVAVLNAWPAIGLLSAPILSPGITNGTVGQSYQISGFAPTQLSLQAKGNFALNQSEKIASILRGGALPVHVIVGIPTTIPPTLGSHFETVSVVALLIAIIAVSVTIAVRYKKMFLIVPIVFTAFAEFFIIISIMGLIGTIDLAAVAGMIAVIGTGVDVQIIITDEVLSKAEEHGLKIRLGNAFTIIWVDAALSVVSMIPLLFSTTLISIIGFAESTILGELFIAFIIRPAYGSIIAKHYSKLEAKK
jgi:preprotein translocase subunit SecD